jgi:integrase
MASIVKFRPAKGSTRERYQVRWRDPEGAQKAKVFELKRDADAFLLEVESSKMVGRYRDPDAGRITLKAAGEAWRARQVHRESTAVQVEGYLRKHVYPLLGDRRLDSIRRSDVQAWVRDRSEVLAPSTVHTVYGFVASIFRDAVHDRLVPETPCVRIALPKKDRPEVVPPTRDEVEALMGALPDRYRVAVVLAAGAGLRLGEVCGVTVDRVNFFAKTLRVDRQLLSPSKGPVRFGPPKTPSSVRTIHLADVVVAELSEHLRKFPVADEGDFAGLVLTSRTGAPVRRGTWQAAWSRAQRDTELGHVRFHDLRHYYASVLISAGCSVKAVQSALGHKNAAETLDIYSHLMPSDEDRTRAAVQAALGPAECATDVQRESGAVGLEALDPAT